MQFQWNSYRSGCVGPVIFGVCIGVPIFRVADSGSSTVRLPNLTDRYEPSVSDSDPSVDGTPAPYTNLTLPTKCKGEHLAVAVVYKHKK